MNQEQFEIEMGRYRVAKKKERLTASGIGSCLVITFFDQKNRSGGMAHATLPICPSDSEDRDETYVDIAIDTMLGEFKRFGSNENDIACKIVGGSNMFPKIEIDCEDIGKRNTEQAKMILKEKGISLTGEATGGVLGRSVEFCTTTGIVTVKIKF
jgi:chemotaxis protein CheD